MILCLGFKRNIKVFLWITLKSIFCLINPFMDNVEKWFMEILHIF